MQNLITFPKLGLEFLINETAFTLPRFLGSLQIKWYGILIAIGFLLAFVYAFKRSKTFGLDSDRVFDVLILSVLVGVIGARFYYVVFSGDYKGDFIGAFKIRNGGLAIYGGLIFGVITAFVVCKIRKVKFLPLFDLAAGSIFIGQAFGRWGNFVNAEAFGTNTDLPWGMAGPAVANELAFFQEDLLAKGITVDINAPVHPTFLYESLWCILGFVIILLLTKRRRFDGQLALVYTGWYGLGRFFFEGLRVDSLPLGNIRVSQLVALICFVGSVIALVVISSRIRRENDASFMPLYVTTEESQQIIAGTFYKKKKSQKDPEKGEATEEKSPEIIDSLPLDNTDFEDSESVVEDNLIEAVNDEKNNELSDDTKS